MTTFLGIDGEVHGPFEVDELQALWHAGEISAASLFWFEGMSGWRPVAEFAPYPGEPVVEPRHVILTTAPTIANREIQTERDIVTAECVLGISLLKELVAGAVDTFGGRSEGMQHELRRARTSCLNELRKEAAELGANAVVALGLNYSEIRGHGKGMLLLVGSGTAVRLKPRPPKLPLARGS